MPKRVASLLLSVAIVLSCLPALGAEPEVEAKDLPRVPPTPAADAIKAFKLHPGLKIELVASEPLVSSPVGICFDEDGRMFVVEMRDYPEDREQRLGRIKLLESTHKDGHYDKATIFAEHIPWPTSCLWAGGALYVTASPDIIRLKDTQHTGHADQREVIFTGFGAAVDRLNVQALVNGLAWGPDNRVHGATSFNGGLVTRPGSNDKPIDLRRRDFSFDLNRLDLRPENSGGKHELSFDD